MISSPVTVEDVATPFVFGNTATNDDFTDPLAGLAIPAGKNAMLQSTGSNAGVVRIQSLTVSVPEPTGVALVVGARWSEWRGAAALDGACRGAINCSP